MAKKPDPKKYERYQQLAHAMQSGVAAKMHKDPSDTTPKHLRVGVNMAMREHAALAGLLIKKGLITDDEYMDALNAGMEEEVEMYKRELRELYGADIDLA